MAEEIDESYINLMATGCKDDLEQFDIIIVARMKDGDFNGWRILKKGQDEEMFNYLMEEKTEEEDVLIWPVSEVCRSYNWRKKYPVGMKDYYKKTRELVTRHETSRRSVDFAGLADGFTLKTEGRSGWLYYKEGSHILEMYVEMSGVSKYNFILSWEGLDSWIYPNEVATKTDEKALLCARVESWLDNQGYKTNPPD